MAEPTPATPPTTKDLCSAWIAAKEAEAKAKRLRVKLEDQLIAIVGKKDKGSQTTEHDGFKVTTTAKWTSSMDWDAWEKVKAQIPVELHPVKQKNELDDAGVAWLKENKPDLYALLPIENKPAKTAVEVKAIPKDEE